jgi:uncharacterized protein YydD (DUF2326 family)
MNILKSHGTLDQFSKLQAETARKEAEVESSHQRFDAAEQLEGTKNELDIERNRLTLRLRRDFAEQKARLSEAILAFEETSKRLYQSAGNMTVDETSNGPRFQFPMQGSRSKGIKNMQIFCFDLMLMRLCAKLRHRSRFPCPRQPPFRRCGRTRSRERSQGWSRNGRGARFSIHRHQERR